MCHFVLFVILELLNLVEGLLGVSVLSQHDVERNGVQLDFTVVFNPVFDVVDLLKLLLVEERFKVILVEVKVLNSIQ